MFRRSPAVSALQLGETGILMPNMSKRFISSFYHPVSDVDSFAIMIKVSPNFIGTNIIFVAICGHSPVHAQKPEIPLAKKAANNDDIVVNAERLPGSVITDVPPIAELTAEDIESYGASSIRELLDALSSETNSSGGRGDGGPIILINGEPSSGLRAIIAFPPEALESVQVFPEELAVQYGYRPDQRVINFIMREKFTGFIAKGEYGGPTRGDQIETELETSITRINKKKRLGINLKYQNKGGITENERNIVQDAAGDGANLGNFRSLVAPSQAIELNTNYSLTVGDDISVSLTGSYVRNKSRRLLGLPSATFNVPATNPFAMSLNDENLFRYFTQFGALESVTKTNTAKASAALNGSLSNWRWSLTADYSRGQTNTATDISGDTTGLQTAIDIGAANPFASDFGPLLSTPITNRARSVSQSISSIATVSGTLLELPSGPVRATWRAGFSDRTRNSRNTVNNITTLSKIGRSNLNTNLNVDIPLADYNSAVSEAIGKLSINGNLGYSEISDFGGLVEFGFGLNWRPFSSLAITASAIGDETAPSTGQLVNPLIITPGVTVFDFINGETVMADIITGGNPVLPAARRRDMKLAINYRPQWATGVRFLGEYFRNSNWGVASSFPFLTPEIEAAFPDRVIRDGAGRLVAIDQRPITYSNVRSENLRYGIHFSKRISMGVGSGKSDTAKPKKATKSTGAGIGGPQGGSWQLSAYHAIRLKSRILIRPGVSELDLLDGSATSASGGTARHAFELNGGWFKNGVGFRIKGEHQTATRAAGGVDGSDLRFSDITKLDLRAFINLNNRGDLTEKFKFLKGSRITVRIDNVLDDIQDVRDGNGLVPLRYQAGFVDPIGRYVGISFRKKF